MRRAIACLALVVFASLATGCFKTTYLNLYSEDYTIPQGSVATNWQPSGWQHFFVWGLLPGERTIDASKLCGEGHVAEIQTRQTFLQGLITAVAGFYINVYAPYTGKAVCDKP